MDGFKNPGTFLGAGAIVGTVCSAIYFNNQIKALKLDIDKLQKQILQMNKDKLDTNQQLEELIASVNDLNSRLGNVEQTQIYSRGAPVMEEQPRQNWYHYGPPAPEYYPPSSEYYPPQYSQPTFELNPPQYHPIQTPVEVPATVSSSVASIDDLLKNS